MKSGQLAAALLLLGAFSAPLAPAEAYRRSNSIGMDLGFVDRAEAGKGFVLRIDDKPGAEERVLFEEGRETRRWTTKTGADGRVLEAAEKDGDRLVRTSYLDTGLVREEATFDGDKLTERKRYAYSDGRLSTIDYGTAEKADYRDEYRYGTDGGLREVARTYADGVVKRSLYAAATGLILEEYHSGYGNDILVRYDESGRPAAQREWKGPDLKRTTVFSYYPNDSRVLSQKVHLEAEGRDEVTRFNKDGDAETDEVFSGSARTETVRYSYASAGKPAKKTIENRDGVFTTSYTYDAEGGPDTEFVTSARGEPVQKIVHTGESERYEEFYRDGAVFVRVFYKDNRAVKEEVVRNGSVIRTRDLGGGQ
jgi:hypothetical protein